jgi:methyl-accepting chemotaxis protein
MANATREHAFPGPREDPSERTFLGGSSLGARFGWLFVVTLIALAGAAGVLYLADQRAGQVLESQAVVSDVSRQIARIESGVVALRSEARAFIVGRDTRAIENYRRINEGLLANVKAFVDDPATIDAQRIATTLNDGLSQHAEQFTNVTRIVGLLGTAPGGGQNAAQSTGLIGNTQSAGQALERRVTEVSTPFAQRVAQLRRIESALVSGTAAPGDRALSEDIDEFRRAVAESTLSPNVKLEIDRLAEAYTADISQLARTRAALANALTRLDEVDAYMAPALEALSTFASDLAQSQRRGAMQERMEIRILIGAGVAAALLFLWLAATILMRSITNPMLRLARAAAELAHGNQVVAIPALGNDDATGAVARSLTYFRENLIQADRLRKELELALQKADSGAAAKPGAAPTPAAAPEPPAVPAPVEAPRGGRALVPTTASEPAGTQISIISRMLADTSQAASAAASEAERTESMVNGLGDALHRIDEIETMLASISDQMSLLAVQTALSDDAGEERENLVLLAEKRANEGRRNVGQSVADRIETIQGGTKRAIKSVQQIGRTIAEVNEVAVQIASDASSEALDAATELLRQSEDLRGMLDDLLTKIRAEGGTAQPQITRRQE